MIAAFLNKIESLANRIKVNLIKINPAPGEQDAEYWKYQADLECSGQLADVISFMHAINSDTDLMKVDKFSFSGKKSDTDEIKATMTIEKIVVTDKPMPPKAQDTNSHHEPSLRHRKSFILYPVFLRYFLFIFLFLDAQPRWKLLRIFMSGRSSLQQTAVFSGHESLSADHQVAPYLCSGV